MTQTQIKNRLSLIGEFSTILIREFYVSSPLTNDELLAIGKDIATMSALLLSDEPQTFEAVKGVTTSSKKTTWSLVYTKTDDSRFYLYTRNTKKEVLSYAKKLDLIVSR